MQSLVLVTFVRFWPCLYGSGSQPQVATQIKVAGWGGDVGSRKGFVDNSIFVKKKQNLYQNSNNDRDSLVLEYVFINFKHTVAITF